MLERQELGCLKGSSGGVLKAGETTCPVQSKALCVNSQTARQPLVFLRNIR